MFSNIYLYLYRYSYIYKNIDILILIDIVILPMSALEIAHRVLDISINLGDFCWNSSSSVSWTDCMNMEDQVQVGQEILKWGLHWKQNVLVLLI